MGAVRITVGEEVRRLHGPIGEDVRLGARGTRDVVGTKSCRIVERAPAVAGTDAFVAVRKQRADQIAVGFHGDRAKDVFDSGVLVGRRKDIADESVERLSPGSGATSRITSGSTS